MTERRKRIWNKARADEFPVIEVRPTDPADWDAALAELKEYREDDDRFVEGYTPSQIRELIAAARDARDLLQGWSGELANRRCFDEDDAQVIRRLGAALQPREGDDDN